MSLLEQFNIKIGELNRQQFPDDDEFKFFETLSKEIASSKDFSNITNTDYLMALVALEKQDTFATIHNVFLELFKYLNIESTEHDERIVDFLTAIYRLKDINLLDEMLKLDHIPNIRELRAITKQYDPQKNGKTSGKINAILEVVSCAVGYETIGLSIFDTFEQLQSFVKIVSKCPNIDVKIIKFLNFKNHYEEAIHLKKCHAKLDEFQVVYTDSTVIGAKEALEAMDISETLKQISDRYYELSKMKEQFTKSINKKILLYKQMVEIIKSVDKKKKINFDEEIFTKLDDSELSLKFIQTLLEYNRKNYSNLELENIKKDNYHQIEKLFWENNLCIEILSENDRNMLLRNGNIEVLKEVIRLLKNEEFSWLAVNHPNYVQILLNTTPIILQTIISLIKSKVISKEFVQHHIGILIDKVYIVINDNDIAPCYSIFRTNIALLLQNTDYLALKLKKNETLAFIDTESLIMHLELMNQYNLNLHSENAKMYGLNILNTPENFDDLDQFIELGYADYMMNNPQLLKEDSKDIIVRLSIMTNIGLNPMNKDNRLKGAITNGKNFYVAQEELNKYRLITVDEYMRNEDFNILKEQKRMTISSSTRGLDIIEYLDNLFKVSDLEYRINNIIISRNKVLRNIECLIQNKEEYDDSAIALSSIVYHSVIDNNTIEIIQEKLNDYKKKYVKKKNL